MKPFQMQSYYELLEVPVSATTEQIRRAYARLSVQYADDQVALYGLVDSGSAGALRARLLEAMEILTDDDLRLLYDRELGLPPRAATRDADDEEPTPSAQLLMNDLLTGADRALQSTHPYVPFSYVSAPAVGSESAPPTPVASPPAVAPVAVPVSAVAPTSSAPPGAAGSPPATAPLTPSGSASAAPTVATPAANAPTPFAPPSGAAAPAASPPDSATPAEFRSAGLPTDVDSPAATASPEPVAPPSVSAPDPTRPGQSAGGTAAPAFTRVPGIPGPRPSPAQAPQLSVSTAIAAAESRLARVGQAIAARDARASAPRPRPPEVPPDAEFNGELLRQIRTAMGLTLQQIAEKTRISARHLEAIEADKYAALPAPVYLRGILMNLARELGLDGIRVSKSYLALAAKAKG